MKHRWEFIGELAVVYHLELGVELGVKEGRFTHHLVGNIPWIHMVAVDLWDSGVSNAHESYQDWPMEAYFHSFVAGMGKYKDRCTVLRMSTENALKYVGDVDFAFIDADHSYEGVKKDIENWSPKCRRFVAGHDYNLESVRTAVDEYFGEVMEGPNNVWLFQC